MSWYNSSWVDKNTNEIYIKMTQFIKMYDTVFSIFKYKNDTIYKNI